MQLCFHFLAVHDNRLLVGVASGNILCPVFKSLLQDFFRTADDVAHQCDGRTVRRCDGDGLHGGREEYESIGCPESYPFAEILFFLVFHKSAVFIVSTWR